MIDQINFPSLQLKYWVKNYTVFTYNVNIFFIM